MAQAESADREDPDSGNCSHEGHASAHSVYNATHRSWEKHLSLLFTLLNKHKSEVSIFSYMCEYKYVHNMCEEAQATFISEVFHLLIFGKELNVLSYVEESFESLLQNHSEQASWLLCFSLEKNTKL